jgi:hypothetical protein
MNKRNIIILLSILFISLAIGLYLVGFKEGIDQENKGTDVNVGGYLLGKDGNLVYANNGNVTITKLTSSGIVIETNPDIQLDASGFPVLNKQGAVTYNPQKYIVDENGQIKVDSNGKPMYNPKYEEENVSSQKYDSNNLDITYHASEKQIISETGSGDLQNNDIYVLNPEIIKARETALKNYKNALASGDATTIATASAALDSNNLIFNKSNADFLAYQNAINSGDANDIAKATEIVSSNPNYIKIAKSNVQGDINYYDPTTFRFGPTTYVPNYEDSVYLSRTTGQSTVGEILNPAYMLGGVCKYYKNQPYRLEEACQKLDKNTCASTSCCVLLGGSKCVSGNSQGPTVKSNFSDIYVRNRDYYYFQGKCYGNCP